MKYERDFPLDFVCLKMGCRGIVYSDTPSVRPQSQERKYEIQEQSSYHDGSHFIDMFARAEPVQVLFTFSQP
jgi:hypothetical protein